MDCAQLVPDCGDPVVQPGGHRIVGGQEAQYGSWPWTVRSISTSQKIIKLHCINPKGKFILSPQEKRRGPRFKVSSEGLSSEINILIRSPIPTLTEFDNALLDHAYVWPYQYVKNHLIRPLSLIFRRHSNNFFLDHDVGSRS